MLKTIIVLSDGTEIASGVGVIPNIRKCKINSMTNSGQELVFGSVCSSFVELTIFCPGGNLGITAGTRFDLYKEKPDGTQKKIGVFNAEKPTRPSANLYKITAYDNVSKLDKDLTAFLRQFLDGRESTEPLFSEMEYFAARICIACGLDYKNSGVLPNRDLAIPQFPADGQTGRLLMQWIGECAGRFCRADENGEIEFAQYTETGITIRPSGELYYLSGSLQYEDYTVAPVDGLIFWFYDWVIPEANNPYTIAQSNLIWSGRGGRAVSWEQDYRLQEETLLTEMKAIGAYTPCRLTIPARLDVRAGDIITVVTQEGKALRVLVMSATMDGQRLTLECTGSASRSGSSATYSGNVGGGSSEAEILSKLGAEWITIDGRQVLAKKEKA